jgi:hypothetical protein
MDMKISLDTAMETWEDDLRRFMLEQEEEDDEFFLFCSLHFNCAFMMRKCQSTPLLFLVHKRSKKY